MPEVIFGYPGIPSLSLQAGQQAPPVGLNQKGNAPRRHPMDFIKKFNWMTDMLQDLYHHRRMDGTADLWVRKASACNIQTGLPGPPARLKAGFNPPDREAPAAQFFQEEAFSAANFENRRFRREEPGQQVCLHHCRPSPLAGQLADFPVGELRVKVLFMITDAVRGWLGPGIGAFPAPIDSPGSRPQQRSCFW